MKIGLVQYNPAWENIEENKLKLDNLVSKCQENYSLLIFPEMTLTGFTMNSVKFAEEDAGTSCRYFSDLAKRLNTEVIAGFIEKADSKIYNSLVHYGTDGALKNKYRKIHPFSFSGENVHYSRGEKPVVSSIGEWKIGLSICYDLRFPELFRTYARERTELMVVIANWPVKRIEHWKALLKARAIENQCYIAAVNRVGTDPGNDYNGFSSIISPLGEELLTLVNDETISGTDISLDTLMDVRKRLPFLNDMFLF
ncbi:MAG TPA: carbon-nitrogen family hydrolase [Ignavibacteriales bacterium]|nr:carbon-nitrogen family hydrolase [Ignavibacteriales bacterium]